VICGRGGDRIATGGGGPSCRNPFNGSKSQPRTGHTREQTTKRTHERSRNPSDHSRLMTARTSPKLSRASRAQHNQTQDKPMEPVSNSVMSAVHLAGCRPG
jgi:hypothetical protein